MKQSFRKEHRTNTRIVCSILFNINEKSLAIGSHLSRSCNLSYYCLMEKLEPLIKYGYVEVVQDKKQTLFKLTEKGNTLLNKLVSLYEEIPEDYNL